MPDILANAGGVIVSYFEWVQDRQGYFWKESEVNERLEELLLANFREVRESALARKISISHRGLHGGDRTRDKTMKARGVYA